VLARRAGLRVSATDGLRGSSLVANRVLGAGVYSLVHRCAVSFQTTGHLPLDAAGAHYYGSTRINCRDRLRRSRRRYPGSLSRSSAASKHPPGCR
jgi:hypothetical protein